MAARLFDARVRPDQGRLEDVQKILTAPDMPLAILGTWPWWTSSVSAVAGRVFGVDDDQVERRLQALERDHRLTRWYTGRVDRDLADIAATQSEHTDKLDEIDQKSIEHSGQLQSIDAQLRSLTTMVGEVLRRLPDPGEESDKA